jgi:hypothetical protein
MLTLSVQSRDVLSLSLVLTLNSSSFDEPLQAPKDRKRNFSECAQYLVFVGWLIPIRPDSINICASRAVASRSAALIRNVRNRSSIVSLYLATIILFRIVKALKLVRGNELRSSSSTFSTNHNEISDTSPRS